MAPMGFEPTTPGYLRVKRTLSSSQHVKVQCSTRLSYGAD